VSCKWRWFWKVFFDSDLNSDKIIFDIFPPFSQLLIFFQVSHPSTNFIDLLTSKQSKLTSKKSTIVFAPLLGSTTKEKEIERKKNLLSAEETKGSHHSEKGNKRKCALLIMAFT
jgi:hypothetical protein